MSRPIKFRAWDDKGKYWYPAETMKDFFNYLSKKFVIIADWFNKDTISLEQYTGLTDKNGKEIYEGDIVSVHHSNMLSDHNKFFGDKALVKCSLNKGGAFTIRNWYGERILNWDIPLRFVEVVGNIHESPELLKEEEK